MDLLDKVGLAKEGMTMVVVTHEMGFAIQKNTERTIYKMAKKFVVTITRQFGSMGRPIAREMSERLGIEYYDKNHQ